MFTTCSEGRNIFNSQYVKTVESRLCLYRQSVTILLVLNYHIVFYYIPINDTPF